MTEQSAASPSVLKSPAPHAPEPSDDPPRPDESLRADDPPPADDPAPAEDSPPAGVAARTDTSPPVSDTAPADDSQAAGDPAPTDTPSPASDTARTGGAGKWLIGAVVVVTLGALAVGGVAVLSLAEQLQQDVSQAGVGDCLDAVADPNLLQRVDCDSPRAAWTVVLRVADVTEDDFADVDTRQELCGPAPDWESAFWIGSPGTDSAGTGDLLCLAPRT